MRRCDTQLTPTESTVFLHPSARAVNHRMTSSMLQSDGHCCM